MTLEEIFASALGIDRARVKDDLEFGTIEEWDSVAHMGLISELEQEYDIMLETDDVIDMSSFAQARVILQKYGVELAA